ncbi:sensor histidine kinase [Streptomyces sp. NPDC002324]
MGDRRLGPALWLGIPVIWRDGLLAVLLCAADLRTQWSSANLLTSADQVPLPVVAGYAIAGYAALAWRRHRPGTVFAVILAHNVLAQLFLPWRPLLGVIVALYTVVARTSLSRSLLALAGASGAFALSIADEVIRTTPDLRDDMATINIILYLALGVTVWGVARIAHRSGRDLRAADARRLRAITEERARIARELHDIVAHSVTVIVLQAAGARRILPSGSPLVNQALANIEATGQQAMGELRRMLGVLASAGMPLGDDTGEVEPPPGLAELNPVVARIVAAGLPVEVNHRGTAQQLDASVELAAHRVVSEGLTNALKHGGAGARTAVLFDWQDDGLVISVTDDGRGHRAADTMALSGGQGLIGLDERVRAVGGHLWAGPLPAGGYRISATLPVPGCRTTA